ncbi:hypothetical protein C8R45DRAFT_1098992 [Mycena sanguinolenta]|nr:hypothetical protein C8R45DRAFT_1098992 [Mycena sanguinolenta]
MTFHNIHSLPTETLSDIFRSAVAAVTPPPSHLVTPVLRTELERIANVPPLALSRVCSRWHDIALKNPTLWSKIEIDAVAGTPPALELTLGLLNARLERSHQAPLSVSLVCLDPDQQPFHPRIFHLLAQYSHRWEQLKLVGSLQGLDTSVLRGRLPRLKTLGVNHDGSLEAVEFFGVAPSLKTLCVTAPLIHSSAVGEILRCKQLRYFGCMVEFADKQPRQPRWLICVAVQNFHPQPMSAVLHLILASLTLPALQRVVLGCRLYPQLALEWPHAQFLALCERSGLGRCLKTLRVAEVRIGEADLLETLSVLPALECLEVGDAPEKSIKRKGKGKGRGKVDQPKALITDSFLQAMTCAPAQDCLVPRLRYFTCVSRMGFTHSLLVDFAMSRFARLSESSIALFHLCIHPFPGIDPGLSSAVRATLRKLAAGQKNFVYEAGEKYIRFQ